jgi:hypothetical protein
VPTAHAAVGVKQVEVIPPARVLVDAGVRHINRGV